MPELREVFEMTTKQMGEPDVDSWREQERRQRRTSRNKKLGALAMAAAVGLVAVVVGIRAADDGTGKQPAVQPTPTPPAGTALENDYLIDLNTGKMTQLPKSIAGNELSVYAVSPDGTLLAYTSRDDAGMPQVFIANLDGTDVQQVTHDRRGALGPDWSPDGAAIAYTGSVNGDVVNIFVLDLATGETSQVTNEKPHTVADFPQFSPDGASIVHDLHRGDSVGVRIVPVTGGKSVPLVGGGKNNIYAAAGTLSPDGSTLAMGCSGRLEGICIADADGTNLRALVSRPSLDVPNWVPNWSPDGTRIAYNNRDTGDKVFVVDVATGETTFVAEGFAPEWLDDHTLIVENTVENT